MTTTEKSQKNYAEWKKPDQKEREKKGVHTVGFHLHKFFKIYSDRKQTRLEMRGGKEERDAGTNYKEAPGNICGW